MKVDTFYTANCIHISFNRFMTEFSEATTWLISILVLNRRISSQVFFFHEVTFTEIGDI